MSEAHPSNTRYQTLSKALAIIDPKGLLMPGTHEQNRVSEMILSWMAEMEPDEVLRMCHDWRRVLYKEGHYWLRKERKTANQALSKALNVIDLP